MYFQVCVSAFYYESRLNVVTVIFHLTSFVSNTFCDTASDGALPIYGKGYRLVTLASAGRDELAVQH